MRLLTLLHRWVGGIAGVLLALIGLSGTVLLWEESWIALPGADVPLIAEPAAIGDAVAAALGEDPALSRITFASEEMGLHQAIYADGGGADPEKHLTVLRAFEFDKAVYEVLYEARNRPNWLRVPLESIATAAGSPRVPG